MLTDIISKIFYSNGYIEIPIDNIPQEYRLTLFHPCDQSHRQEYYAVLEHLAETESFLDDVLERLADDFFDLIAATRNINEYFEKNSTLIICQKSGSANSHTVLKLKEDAYNFKKNVITYTAKEFASLHDKLLEIPSLQKDFFNSLINAKNGEIFRDYKKKSGNTDDYYSLLLKISSKLPFLTYAPPKHELENLDTEINSKLDDYEKRLYDAISNYRRSNTSANIENLIDELSKL
jgi:diphthamide synthase subunit DPH2